MLLAVLTLWCRIALKSFNVFNLTKKIAYEYDCLWTPVDQGHSIEPRNRHMYMELRHMIKIRDYSTDGAGKVVFISEKSEIGSLTQTLPGLIWMPQLRLELGSVQPALPYVVVLNLNKNEPRWVKT